jgi:flagellar assembly factor FliW
MQIQTKYLGNIEVEEKQIIRFPKGLPAFEGQQQFVFLPFDDDGIFFYMQSLEDTELCLIVCNPFQFFPNYQIDLGDQECQLLEVNGPDDVALMAILTIPEDFRHTTANLLAPVVINTRANLGLQFIPADSDYTTKESIFPGIHKNVAAGEGK